MKLQTIKVKLLTRVYFELEDTVQFDVANKEELEQYIQHYKNVSLKPPRAKEYEATTDVVEARVVRSYDYEPSNELNKLT